MFTLRQYPTRYTPDNATPVAPRTPQEHAQEASRSIRVATLIGALDFGLALSGKPPSRHLH